MSSRTRVRLMIGLVLGLITMPAEALLLTIAHAPDSADAARAWADDLSTEERQSASLQIDAYPQIYRRAIMRGLDPRDRADAWRAILRRYLNTEHELTRDQVRVVQDAMELLSEETFTPPVAADVQVRIRAVFDEAVGVLGPATASELFVTLGPKDGRGRNPLPLRQRLADHVRAWLVVSAELPDCTCNIDIDTCDVSWNPWLKCSELYTCDFDLEWPMCGPLWSWACKGWCKIIRFPYSVD